MVREMEVSAKIYRDLRRDTRSTCGVRIETALGGGLNASVDSAPDFNNRNCCFHLSCVFIILANLDKRS